MGNKRGSSGRHEAAAPKTTTTKGKGGKQPHSDAYKAALLQSTVFLAREIEETSGQTHAEIERALDIGAKKDRAETSNGMFSMYLNGKERMSAARLVQLATLAHRHRNAEGRPWLSLESLQRILDEWTEELKMQAIFATLADIKADTAPLDRVYQDLRSAISNLTRYAKRRGVELRLHRPELKRDEYTDEQYLRAIKEEVLVAIGNLAIAAEAVNLDEARERISIATIRKSLDPDEAAAGRAAEAAVERAARRRPR